MSRGAPSEWKPLVLPVRQLRPAQTTCCPDCHDQVAVRSGHIAGHYAVGRELCSGSSKPVATDREASA